MSEHSSSQTPDAPPALGYVLRLFWMAFGNIALLFAGLEVARSDRMGRADAVYWALALALLIARYLDVTKLRGMTIHAEPATRIHLRRYAVVLTAVATLGWLFARSI